MTMGRKRTDYGFFATYLAQLLFYPILTYWDKLPLLHFHPTSHLYFFYCKICYNNINHTWNYNWIDRFKSKLDFTENWIILFKVFNKKISLQKQNKKKNLNIQAFKYLIIQSTQILFSVGSRVWEKIWEKIKRNKNLKLVRSEVWKKERKVRGLSL